MVFAWLFLSTQSAPCYVKSAKATVGQSSAVSADIGRDGSLPEIRFMD
jgi:hypothetical protein